MRTNEQYRLKGAKIAAKKRQAEMLKETPTLLIVDGKKCESKNEKISLDGHEWVARFACTLIGFLDGKYFGCSFISLDNIPECKKDMVDLFFNETEKQSDLPNSPQMSTSRAKEFSDKLCKQLNEAGYAETSTVLNKLHAVWEKRQLDEPIKHQQPISSFNLQPIEKKPLSMSELLISEQPKPISKAAQEALIAKQRREENERKTQERKAQKAADIAQKKANAEKAKLQAEADRIAEQESIEKARQEALITQQKADEKAAYEARIAIEKQAIQELAEKSATERKDLECLLRPIESVTDIAPVYDEKMKRFYGKQNGNVIEIRMNPNKPTFQVFTRDDSRIITWEELDSFIDLIDKNLNANGQHDAAFEQMPTLYKKFETTGLLTDYKDILNCYKDICTKLQGSSTFQNAPTNSRLVQKAKIPELLVAQHTK